LTSAKRQRLMKGFLKAGELAEEAGVRVSTVKYYTDRGLISFDDRTQGGCRLYSKEKTLKKILLIRQLTRRRLSLKGLAGVLVSCDCAV